MMSKLILFSIVSLLASIPPAIASPGDVLVVRYVWAPIFCFAGEYHVSHLHPLRRWNPTNHFFVPTPLSCRTQVASVAYQKSFVASSRLP